MKTRHRRSDRHGQPVFRYRAHQEFFDSISSNIFFFPSMKKYRASYEAFQVCQTWWYVHHHRHIIILLSDLSVLWVNSDCYALAFCGQFEVILQSARRGRARRVSFHFIDRYALRWFATTSPWRQPRICSKFTFKKILILGLVPYKYYNTPKIAV